MRYVGIDIASQTHVVAILDQNQQVICKPTEFTEDAEGYQTLLRLLGSPQDSLIIMEATGHYWQNLFVVLTQQGFSAAVLNPARSHRFAAEDLQRGKTDRIDALSLARFGAQKSPLPQPLPDELTEQLKELVRLRSRLQQDFDNRVRQLHRLVDLGFPEFTRYVRSLGSQLATTILAQFPTAKAFSSTSERKLAKLCYDGRHRVGEQLAHNLLEAARQSVGQHHAPVYQLEVRYLCEDIDLLRQRLLKLDSDLEQIVRTHPLGALYTTIGGIGPLTSALLLAELGDPCRFYSSRALAAYVGPIPFLRQSGLRKPSHATLAPIGHARLRKALWMPTLTAVRVNPWLRAYYQSLLARGKPPKVALVACMRKLLTAVYSVAKNRRPFIAHVVTASQVLS